MTIKTCETCGCAYSIGWGGHYCMTQLPEMPEEFRQARVVKGETVPKCDYHDRRAWLEVATGQLDGSWRAIAADYRRAAEVVARAAKIRELAKTAAQA